MKKINSFSLKLFLVGFLAALTVHAKTPATSVTKPAATKTTSNSVFDLTKSPSTVEFLAIGKPSMLKINGTGAKLAGTVTLNGTILNAKLGVAVKNFVTGLELRDEHMKNKYLEVEKFPTAILQVTNFDLGKDILKSNGPINGLVVKGQLTLHGATKEVTVELNIDSTAQAIAFDTTTKFLITDYGIVIPSYMGIKIADEVTLKVTGSVKK